MLQAYLFVMDPFEKLNLTLDSSLRMASALSELGHKCYHCTAKDLSWNSKEGRPFVLASLLDFANHEAAAMLESPLRRPLNSFSGILMRKEPPFDIEYLACSWMLDAVANEVRIFNAPSALRAFNEKLGIMQFKDHIGLSLAASKPSEILDFIANDCEGDAVVKPLDQFGGKGIIRICLSKISREQAKKCLLQSKGASTGSMRLVQAFNAKIYEGEVRAFTLAGKALCWSLKVPAPGSYLANTSAGAQVLAYTPDQEIENRVESIASSLLERGLSMVGMDLIGGLISEINVTSPRLLQAPEDTKNPYEKIATWLQASCSHGN